MDVFVDDYGEYDEKIQGKYSLEIKGKTLEELRRAGAQLEGGQLLFSDRWGWDEFEMYNNIQKVLTPEEAEEAAKKAEQEAAEKAEKERREEEASKRDSFLCDIFFANKEDIEKDLFNRLKTKEKHFVSKTKNYWRGRLGVSVDVSYINNKYSGESLILRIGGYKAVAEM